MNNISRFDIEYFADYQLILYCAIAALWSTILSLLFVHVQIVNNGIATNKLTFLLLKFSQNYTNTLDGRIDQTARRRSFFCVEVIDFE